MCQVEELLEALLCAEVGQVYPQVEVDLPGQLQVPVGMVLPVRHPFTAEGPVLCLVAN